MYVLFESRWRPQFEALPALSLVVSSGMWVGTSAAAMCVVAHSTAEAPLCICMEGCHTSPAPLGVILFPPFLSCLLACVCGVVSVGEQSARVCLLLQPSQPQVCCQCTRGWQFVCGRLAVAPACIIDPLCRINHLQKT